jgi:tetratricopeptide (TPR) repeat protein
MRREIVICFVLVALTVGVYWPVGHYPFVAYDDLDYVADNPHVKAGLTWEGMCWVFSHLTISNWHPLTSLSHLLDCQVFGLDPGAHHLVNVALHAANTLLLFVVLNGMTAKRWRSASAAGLFALHPLHIESVAWVSERKDVLSGFFFLLTLLAYVRYVEKSKVQGPRSKVWLGVALLLFVLGMMSKPMLVSVPFVLLLLDYWPLRRTGELTGSADLLSAAKELGSPNPAAKSANHTSQITNRQFRVAGAFRLLLEKLPFFILSIAFCILTLLVQRSGGAMKAAVSIPFSERAANAVVSYWVYLGKTLWPMRLAVIYPHPSLQHRFFEVWPVWQVGLLGLLLVAVTVACLVWRRQASWFMVGWLWFLGTLVPVIGLVQVGTQAMADRYTYLPLIGIFIAVVWAATELGAKVLQRSQCTVYASVAGLLLIACLIGTRHQLAFWRSTAALFKHTLAVTEDNPASRSLLAIGLESEGHIDEAIAQFTSVAAVDAQYQPHLAYLLGKQGRWQEATDHYQAAVKAAPKDSALQLGLAEALQKLGRDKEAIECLETALQIDPESVQALNNLAWIRATHPDAGLRNGAQAVRMAELACELTQYKQTIFIGTLAATYAEVGRFQEAVATGQKACDLAAKNAEQALLERNEQLLELYRRGQAYREGLK